MTDHATETGQGLLYSDYDIGVELLCVRNRVERRIAKDRICVICDTYEAERAKTHATIAAQTQRIQELEASSAMLQENMNIMLTAVAETKAQLVEARKRLPNPLLGSEREWDEGD